MKHLFLTISIVLMGLSMFAQEVQFPAAIVSAGGGSSGSAANLSRWRLAPIHVITLNTDTKIKSTETKKSLPLEGWDVSLYPNPVKDFLHLEFEVPEKEELCIKISDIAGRIIFIQEARTFINGSTDEINMSTSQPALYLLHIYSSDLKTQKIYRIQKI